MPFHGHITCARKTQGKKKPNVELNWLCIEMEVGMMKFVTTCVNSMLRIFNFGFDERPRRSMPTMRRSRTNEITLCPMLTRFKCETSAMCNLPLWYWLALDFHVWQNANEIVLPIKSISFSTMCCGATDTAEHMASHIAPNDIVVKCFMGFYLSTHTHRVCVCALNNESVDGVRFVRKKWTTKLFKMSVNCRMPSSFYATRCVACTTYVRKSR